jgi:hypothetical protein
MKSTLVKIFLVFLFYEIAGNFVVSQNSWPAMSWNNAQNLTPAISSSGIAELSGLYWNDDLKRLYMVENKGSIIVYGFAEILIQTKTIRLKRIVSDGLNHLHQMWRVK